MHSTRLIAPGSRELLDFSYADQLASVMLEPGRLSLGNALVEAPKSTLPILFVPGGYHGAWCYAHFIEACDDAGVPSAAIDLRGHGGLEQAPEFPATTLEDYADDLVAAMDWIAQPVVLVGHSMAGLIAPLAAIQRRSLTAGLVLLTPSPPGNMQGAQLVRPVPEDRPISPPSSALAQERFLGGEEIADESELIDRLCPESPRALNQRYRLAIEIDASAINCPVLCVSAGRDTPERHPPGQDSAAAAFYSAEHIHFATSPHSMMYAPGWRNVLDALVKWRNELRQ